ncbi:hypothetical protein Leryth_026781 [Lithospermum erythrorhizon]|nr:hypothetical protein Leryth_026781 [Lithospermum erythrorhizon]
MKWKQGHSLFLEIHWLIMEITTIWLPQLEQMHLLMGLIPPHICQLDVSPMGKTFLILSGEYLEAEPTLPYLSPELRGQRLLIGANFASAGVGILNDTGVQFVNIIRIWQQLGYFEQYQRRVAALIVRSRQYSIPDYVPFLITEYQKVLERLYDLGARSILVTGTGPLGCVPAELALHSLNGECAPQLQLAANLFNPQLTQLINQLNSNFGCNNCFIAANTNAMHLDFINDPQAYGFITSKVACCGQGRFNGIGLCTGLSSVCPNRDIYAFWDAFHPSEKANRLIVQQIVQGSEQYMHPMNLSTVLAFKPIETKV